MDRLWLTHEKLLGQRMQILEDGDASGHLVLKAS